PFFAPAQVTLRSLTSSFITEIERHSGRRAVQKQYSGDLYIPQDERRLRAVQRRGESLDSTVRDWSATVVEVLPKALPLIKEELAVIGLFLAQQRRLNLELDARNPDSTLRERFGKLLPFLGDASPDLDAIRAVHRIVSTRPESDIDLDCGRYSEAPASPALSAPGTDRRVPNR